MATSTARLFGDVTKSGTNAASKIGRFQYRCHRSRAASCSAVRSSRRPKRAPSLCNRPGIAACFGSPALLPPTERTVGGRQAKEVVDDSASSRDAFSCRGVVATPRTDNNARFARARGGERRRISRTPKALRSRPTTRFGIKRQVVSKAAPDSHIEPELEIGHRAPPAVRARSCWPSRELEDLLQLRRSVEVP